MKKFIATILARLIRIPEKDKSDILTAIAFKRSGAQKDCDYEKCAAAYQRNKNKIWVLATPWGA